MFAGSVIRHASHLRVWVEVVVEVDAVDVVPGDDVLDDVDEVVGHLRRARVQPHVVAVDVAVLRVLQADVAVGKLRGVGPVGRAVGVQPSVDLDRLGGKNNNTLQTVRKK